ncbi:MAG: hypothetical protein PHE50_04050 [Dehalococcoidales bacterium]|nr:hypothetical protein [Dehalococcoidales bacterium]
MNVEPKKAIEVLQKILENHTLTTEEKEAIIAAIGMLSWGSLAQSRLKNLKNKRDTGGKW